MIYRSKRKDSIVNSQDKEYDNNIFVDDSTELNYRNIITKIKTFVPEIQNRYCICRLYTID